MTKKPKLISSIRAKLVSAVAMLLVAMIMVVSSTYAWFTLSTAPEVTGISTQIGANGALEMALLPLNGVDEISSSVGDGALTALKKNITWGNLVNLSEGYGLDKITLYPSTLNVDGNGAIAVSPLGFPEYGSDGRVNQIETGKTVVGVLEEGKDEFYQNNLFGVRGVGAASGMTSRQLSYRNAKAAGGTFKESARGAASKALNENGSALANIAIEHGMGGTESYDKADVTALRALVEGTKKAVASIEKAYMNYIAAYAASLQSQNTVSDTLAQAIFDTVANTDTLFGDDGFMAILEENGVSALPTGLTEAIDKLETTKNSVDTAETALAALEAVLETNPDATFGWASGTVTTYKTDASGNYVGADGSTVLYYKVGEEYYAAADCEVSDGVATPKTDVTAKTEANMTDRVVDKTTDTLGIKDAMTPLANTDHIQVNGYGVGNVKENLGDIVGSVTTDGLKVTMNSGAGVFADIADHCGDYSASVTIEKVEYNGIKLNNMNARMETKTTVQPRLDLANTVVVGAGSPTGSGTVMPISEFYGYIIDLAFRTNAPDSNLLLQTGGIDRIYDGNNNESTMGHGSTMMFSAPDTSFSNDQIKALMSNLRVVFFEPTIGDGDNLGTVLAYAKLDMDQAFLNDSGYVEAPLYLYKEVTTSVTTYKTDVNGNYVDENGTVLYYIIDDEYYAAATCTIADDGTVTPNDGATAVAEEDMRDRATVTTERTSEIFLTGDTEDNKPVITAMTQNKAMAVSALVYLDGENLTNKDVSATVAKSLEGKMNLQFASSANLVPMEYSNLNTPNEEEPENP